MKKIFSAILVLCMVFTFVACSKTTLDNNKTTNKSQIIDTSDSLVIYFSVTGNTKNIAKSMATILNTKSLEIVPKKSYSDEDINYNNDDCRANKEQNDKNARPEISNDLSEIKNYDNIYIGYPIWWGTNPKIINTFFENYDLSDKKIYLFCTSGSSGVEESVSNLKSAYSDVNIIDGHRFSSSESKSDISEWLNNLK